MSAVMRIRQWQRVARQRRFFIVFLVGLPLALGLSLLAWRFASMPIAISLLLAGIVAMVFFALRSTRSFDDAWLIRQLDQRLANVEDSSDLLFRNDKTYSALQNLQRERVEERLSGLNHLDLRETWPWKKIGMVWSLGLALGCVAFFWPQTKAVIMSASASHTDGKTNTAVPVRLTNQQINIHAPAYTGLGMRSENALQSKFPEGSTLGWKLKFQPQPTSANLLFHDGSRLDLQLKGDTWQGSRTMMQSGLYRLQVNGKALKEDKLYRLDAIKDLPPQIRVLLPNKNLSLVELGQTHWPLSFEAEDDYGLAGAQLRIQLAQGSGENIKFKEQTLAMNGEGSRARKRYAQQLDLASLGVGPGDDVIIQFSISDQRAPQINTTHSSSFILRWPPEASVETTGVEGMVQKAIPAYFRSQRQIIIDTEKLLADKPKLSADKFATQSDAIGVDQRILRLRYGQFLGEEAEGGRDESASPSAREGKEVHDEHAGEPPKKPGTSADQNLAIAAEFGHVHDIAEAATLLDPQTKKLLRAALDEMWQAELNLRQGEPKKALPYEYRALAFIKKVQQADRIYLARVGLDLPPVDESRRLSGDRSTLKSRNDFLHAADVEDIALIKFWQSLDPLEQPGAASQKVSLDFAALRNWIREHPARSSDALGLLVALDALEQKPRCADCLKELKAQLWPMLPKPAATPQPRVIQNRDGQSYLDALQRERKQ